jgi:hypothetical protein
MCDNPPNGSAAGSAHGTSSAHGGGAAFFGPTGRMIGRNVATHEVATSWARLRTVDEMLTHPAAEQFRQSIAVAPVLTGGLLTFRGRSLPPSPAPTWERMGPPSTPSSENRYSLRNAAPLYSCLTERGVARELTAQQGELVFVQRFLIPTDSARLLDLSQAEDGEFLNDVLFFAEIASNDVRSHASLLYTQILAELASEANFDGLIVRGVRGDDAVRYCNVVIFAPSAVWRTWCDQRWIPIPIT